MKKNVYNEEEKFSKLINDLKELPKEKAPDNFEYNIMTCIHNKNFVGLKLGENQRFNFIRFFAPSAVVISAIIIFFLVLSESNQQIENPLMADPPAISGQIEIEPNNPGVQDDMYAQKSKTQQQHKQLTANNIAVKPNDVVEDQKVRYPINKNRSVLLDDYISGSNKKRTNFKQGSVVSEAEEMPEFDGFFMRQDADPLTIQKYKQMMDSIKKAQEKEDSIKRVVKEESSIQK